TILSLGLVLVSPNMTYPKLVAAGAKTQIAALEKKQAGGQDLTEKDRGEMEKAKKTFEANKDGTSMIGLDAPLFKLRNPGIVSIPIGFLAAIIFALLFPNKSEEEKFD
ncbi:MAG: cation acetate symporter, partial [Deltaproteobacteria bacterium]|nr:cation acetate symporter [Deltaproteobacteria bacterium]